MSQLMLINPKRRRRRKTTRRRRRNPVAANPRRRRRKTTRRRRRNPVAANPRRRRTYRRRTRRNPKFSVRSISRDAIVPAAIGGVGALGVDIGFGMLPLPANFKTGMIGSVAKIATAIVAGKLVGKMTNRKTGEAFTVGAVTIQAYNLISGLAQNAMPNLPLSGDPNLQYYSPGLGYTGAGQTVQQPYSTGLPNYAETPGVGEYIGSQYADTGMGEYLGY